MRIQLLGEPYQSQSIIASRQRCINLYAEKNEGNPQSPAQITYYPTPGTIQQANANLVRSTRCTYRTSKGTAYVVIGPSVFFLDVNLNLSVVGFIADRTSQVIAADNGLTVVLTDGINGYAIDMQSNAFGPIIDPSFYGADYVAFLDTFFIFNRPGTNQFYISLGEASFGMLTNSAIDSGTISNAGSLYTNGTYTNVPLTGGNGVNATADIVIAGGVITTVTIDDPGYNYIVGNILSADVANLGGTGAGFTYTVATVATAFDPLDIAAKSGSADPISWIITVHQNLWLGGELTTEIWIGTGAADFFFQQIQGAYIDHGCAASFSAAAQDVIIFWLMQDKQGSGIVLKGVGVDITEISTPAIVQEFKSYPTIADAIGFCFQIEDHAFYCLVFPTANKTWLYELKTGFWCEWAWTDNNGRLNRHRANTAMFVYNKNLIGDWESGILYSLEPNVYNDFGGPITRIRTFPHLIDDGNQLFYDQFIADIEVASEYKATDAAPSPMIGLKWSDNKGVSYGDTVLQSMGEYGAFETQVAWQGLGTAKDRVFELEWSEDIKTALNGAFIDVSSAVGSARMKRQKA